jgi:hypothetical protein
VILTREEYEQIVRQKAKAESEAAAAKKNAAAAIEQADRDAQRKIREAAEETQKEKDRICQALSEAEIKIEYWRDLNENLLRIARERANADRKLKPKKEHTGYLVVSSGEKEMSYKDGNGNLRRKVLWETVIQSPYSVDFTEQQARKQITEELLRKDENGLRMIDQIGIDGLYRKGYGSLLYDQEFCKEPEKFNIMLKPKFRENFRAGYWEAVFFHTKPLGIVPKDMRVS